MVDDDLRWLMADPRGRRFMWSLLERTGLFRLSFAGTEAETAFNEGHRDIGLTVFNDVMRVAPDLYLTMAREAGQASQGERDDR